MAGEGSCGRWEGDAWGSGVSSCGVCGESGVGANMEAGRVMPETDAKAGYCGNCRQGAHTLCASASCTCPDMRKHRNRPGFASVDRDRARLTTVPVPPVLNEPKRAAVTWEEPPGGARGRQSPFLDPAVESELRTNPGRWAKIRTYTKQSSAGSAGARVRKGLTSLKPEEWEATARRSGGGSVLYLRFVGGR